MLFFLFSFLSLKVFSTVSWWN